jgi:dihydroorotase
MTLRLVGGEVVNLQRQTTEARLVEVPGAFGTQRSIDATGCWIAPGFVDVRSVISSPADADAAVRAGVTAVGFRAQSVRSVFPTLLRRIEIGRVTASDDSEQLAEIESETRVISNGSTPLPNMGVLRRALQYVAPLNITIMLHAEDSSLVGQGVVGESALATRLGLRGVPPTAETAAVAAVLEVLQECGGRLHFSHLSCARSLNLVERAKEKGLRLTCDVSIAHALFDDRQLEQYSTSARVWPPLRSEADCLMIRSAIESGVVDVIAFDHRSQEVEARESFEVGPFGIESYRLAWPALWKIAASRFKLLAALTTGPRQLLGLSAPINDLTLINASSGEIEATIIDGEPVFCQEKRLL